MDFRNATDLFADPDFDGDPIRVKPVSETTDLGTIIDDEENSVEPIIDIVNGDEIELIPPVIRNPIDDNIDSTVSESKNKVYVNGVDVSILISREMYFDQFGKPITTSLKDHTKTIIKGKYASIDEFINQWKTADRKEAIIAELVEQGVMVEALYDAVLMF